MVKTLATNASQEPFTNRTCPWGLHGCPEDFDPRCDALEVSSVFVVIVSNKVLWPDAERGCLSQLQCNPGISRRPGDTYMDDLPSPQFDDEEGKQPEKQQIIDLQEVTGQDLVFMILQECRPV
jgi:hypothetical protein